MLINLINDMMDLAKTENMKFDLNNKLFDLTQTIERSFDNMGYLSKDKKVSLILNIEDKILPFIKNLVGDEGRYT